MNYAFELNEVGSIRTRAQAALDSVEDLLK